MPINVGDTILLAETIYDKMHLHIVLKIENDILIAINITKQLPRSNPGRNCVVVKDDHSWLVEDSFANILGIKKLKKSIIEKDIEDRIIPTREPASSEFIAKLISFCDKYKSVIPKPSKEILFPQS